MKSTDKKIFFLVAMPRTGNTLFASLMNQNPNVAVTANSITLEIMKVLYLLKTTDVFQNYPDHHSLDNVMDMVFDTYYKDWPQEYIIDRGPVTTPGNFMLMKKHFKQPIKCVVLLRDLIDVVASWIKYSIKNPNNFIRNNTKNIDESLHKLMLDDSQIPKDLKALQFLLKPENRHMACFIHYDELISDTKGALNKVYKFLDIPYFEHDLNNLSQFKVNGLSYDDRILGDNIHTIRTNGIYKEDNPYKKLIPQWFINKYGHIKF
jgi:sulfotransferase